MCLLKNKPEKKKTKQKPSAGEKYWKHWFVMFLLQETTTKTEKQNQKQ